MCNSMPHHGCSLEELLVHNLEARKLRCSQDWEYFATPCHALQSKSMTTIWPKKIPQSILQVHLWNKNLHEQLIFSHDFKNI